MPAQHPNQPPEKDRRRSCRDRWKYQWHQRRRRATADPATSVFLQLLALILLIVDRVPLPSPPVPAARPRPAVRRLPDSRSPEAVERERGEGAHLMPPRRDSRRYGRYKATPTYRRLVRDIQRPAARKEALDVLRQRLRLPIEAAGWLDELERDGELAALLPHVRPGTTDMDSEAALLLAAVEWLEAQRDTELPPSPPTPLDDDGDGRGGKHRGGKPPPDDDDDGPPPPGGSKP